MEARAAVYTGGHSLLLDDRDTKKSSFILSAAFLFFFVSCDTEKSCHRSLERGGNILSQHYFKLVDVVTTRTPALTDVLRPRRDRRGVCKLMGSYGKHQHLAVTRGT